MEEEEARERGRPKRRRKKLRSFQAEEIAVPGE